MTAPIHIYGSWTDFLSISTVSRAVTTELSKARIPFTVRNVHSMSMTYTGVDSRLVSPFSKSPVAMFIGYPPAAPGWLKFHDHKIIYMMCETDRIPKEWVSVVNEFDQVYVPSGFCEAVLKECNVKVPVKVVHHGVHGVMQSVRTEFAAKPLKLLHVSGALSFPERKGTGALIKAVSLINLERPGSLQLELLTHDSKHLRDYLAQMGMPEGTFKIWQPEGGLAPAQMIEYLKQFAAVVQPSRGEGFGIVPLEARCLGIPAILTDVTGHKDHFAHGVDIAVPTEGWTKMETQANEVGYAPLIGPGGIKTALETFMANPGQHATNTAKWASQHSREWTWEARLRPLVLDFKELARKHRVRRIKLADPIRR